LNETSPPESVRSASDYDSPEYRPKTHWFQSNQCSPSAFAVGPFFACISSRITTVIHVVRDCWARGHARCYRPRLSSPVAATTASGAGRGKNGGSGAARARRRSGRTLLGSGQRSLSSSSHSVGLPVKRETSSRYRRARRGTGRAGKKAKKRKKAFGACYCCCCCCGLLVMARVFRRLGA